MILKRTIKGVRFTFTVARVTKVIGVNSKLEDGTHILMWDFDDIPLHSVMANLSDVQKEWNLSDIYVLRTKDPDNYIAYCFTALPWREVVRVIASTPLVDWNFLKYGVYREHFTLRVTPKSGREIKPLVTLQSGMPPNCKPSDLLSWVKYETLSD